MRVRLKTTRVLASWALWKEYIFLFFNFLVYCRIHTGIFIRSSVDNLINNAVHENYWVWSSNEQNSRSLFGGTACWLKRSTSRVEPIHNMEIFLGWRNKYVKRTKLKKWCCVGPIFHNLKRKRLSVAVVLIDTHKNKILYSREMLWNSSVINSIHSKIPCEIITEFRQTRQPIREPIEQR